jgi:3-oxoacyl-[acyl-carrier protein] reductase
LLSLKNEISGVYNCRVNAVAPGWTATEKKLENGITDETKQRATTTMALKKLATPEDVANAVAVLSSDEVSGHITGEIVTVAGGMEGRIID